MSKSKPPLGATPPLSPFGALVFYCLAKPDDRRAAVREILGEAEAAQLLGGLSSKFRVGTDSRARDRDG